MRLATGIQTLLNSSAGVLLRRRAGKAKDIPPGTVSITTVRKNTSIAA